MPLDTPDITVLVEDVSGTTVHFTDINAYRTLLTFAGMPFAGIPNENHRRLNVKKTIWFNEYLIVRDRLIEIIESNDFERIVSGEAATIIRLGNDATEPLWIGFEDGQAYIGLYNTVGKRKIEIYDVKQFLQNLLEAFLDIEHWFDGFLENAPQLRVTR